MKKMQKILRIFLILGIVFLQAIFNEGMLAFGEEKPKEESVETEVEIVEEEKMDIFIKAVNPGYTVDGVSNVGEMIELSRKKADEKVSLAGLTIGYTNSSGNYSILFEFPENSYFTGENLVLRLSSSPESDKANANYTKTLAFKGGIELKIGEEVVDSLCWTGGEGCYKEFKSGSFNSLVRDLETGEFLLTKDYEVNFKEENYFLEEIKEEEILPQCKGMIFSEILSYYEETKTEQFIELYNSGSEQILLNGCKLRYKNQLYELNGIVKAEGYYVYYPSEFSLTKNPTTSNTLELIDTDGEVIDKLEYPNGQRKGMAYMMVGYDGEGKEIWKITYAPTPGEANNYQEFKSCEEGKVINEETGNCVKATTVTETVCGEGQYLNPLTGRCKKYETETETVCKEGYYYYEATGRCRKIVENDGAEYELVPEEYEEESNFIGVWAVIFVVVLGVGVVIYEFREEIRKGVRKVFRKGSGGDLGN